MGLWRQALAQSRWQMTWNVHPKTGRIVGIEFEHRVGWAACSCCPCWVGPRSQRSRCAPSMIVQNHVRFGFKRLRKYRPHLSTRRFGNSSRTTSTTNWIRVRLKNDIKFHSFRDQGILPWFNHSVGESRVCWQQDDRVNMVQCVTDTLVCASS